MRKIWIFDILVPKFYIFTSVRDKRVV